MKLILTFLFSISFVACSSSPKPTEPPKEETKVTAAEPAAQTLKPVIEPAPVEEAKNHVEHTIWSYSGLTGPEMWGDLKEDFVTCKNGKYQSPIDLKWKKPNGESKIEFNYKDTSYNIVDNGHTIQVKFEPGNLIKIQKKEYELVQLHFHAHSEHALSGKHFPLEAHFVHKDKEGQLAVLGVFFIEGQSNPFLESMWQQLPREKNRQIASTTSFNPSNLLPNIHTRYHYMGSLTTPPCSENVNWNVFNTPMEMSREQINHFKVLYSKNFRPLQQINHRPILNY